MEVGVTTSGFDTLRDQRELSSVGRGGTDLKVDEVDDVRGAGSLGRLDGIHDLARGVSSGGVAGGR